MSDYLHLEQARQNLGARLAEIKEISINQRGAGDQNYDKISHNFVDETYLAHIATLRTKRQPTAQDLIQLIISGFNCNYNFVCGDRLEYRWYRSSATREEERMGKLHDNILDAYFSLRQYEKVIKLFAAHPEFHSNKMGAMIYIKALLWTGRYAACVQNLDSTYQWVAGLPATVRNFYLLQHALCAMHSRQFSEAERRCKQAWDLTVDLAPPGLYHFCDLARQRPSIAWLRAQINYRLRRYPAALCNIKELQKEIIAFPKGFWPILSTRGAAYLTDFEALIESKIN